MAQHSDIDIVLRFVKPRRPKILIPEREGGNNNGLDSGEILIDNDSCEPALDRVYKLTTTQLYCKMLTFN